MYPGMCGAGLPAAANMGGPATGCGMGSDPFGAVHLGQGHLGAFAPPARPPAPQADGQRTIRSEGRMTPPTAPPMGPVATSWSAPPPGIASFGPAAAANGQVGARAHTPPPQQQVVTEPTGVVHPARASQPAGGCAAVGIMAGAPGAQQPLSQGAAGGDQLPPAAAAQMAQMKDELSFWKGAYWARNNTPAPDAAAEGESTSGAPAVAPRDGGSASAPAAPGDGTPLGDAAGAGSAAAPPAGTAAGAAPRAASAAAARAGTSAGLGAPGASEAAAVDAASGPPARAEAAEEPHLAEPADGGSAEAGDAAVTVAQEEMPLDMPPAAGTPTGTAVDTMEQGMQTTPPKHLALVSRDNRSARRAPNPLQRPRAEGRLSLIQVGIEQVGCQGKVSGRPQRHRITPLCHWKNEQVVYERKPGSNMPTVAGIVVAKPSMSSGRQALRDMPLPMSEPVPLAPPTDGESTKEAQSPQMSEYEPGAVQDTPPSKRRRKATSADRKAARAAVVPAGTSMARAEEPAVGAAVTTATDIESDVTSRAGGKSKVAKSRAASSTKVAGKPAAAAAAGSKATTSRAAAFKRPAAAPAPQRRPPVRRKLPLEVAEPEPAEAEVPEVLAPATDSADEEGFCEDPQADKAAPPSPVPEADEPPTPEKVERLRGGYFRVPTCPGSKHGCQMRIGHESCAFMSCDIRIPPQSFNAPELLSATKTVFLYILDAEDGRLTAALNDRRLELQAGDHFLVRPQQQWSIQNTSKRSVASMKMVLLTSPSIDGVAEA